MKRTFTITLVSLLLTGFGAFAQIDSIRVIPSNPTENDIIKVVAYTTFAKSGCSLINSTITQPGGNLIDVSSCHNLGATTATCTSVDTVTVGTFSAGTYTLRYKVKEKGVSSLNCPSIVADSMDASVTISVGTGIDKLTLKEGLFIYPNPTTGDITIRHNNVLKEDGSKLVFYNIIGQPVKILKLDASVSTQKVSISELPQGTYFYRVESPSFNGAAQKISIIH